MLALPKVAICTLIYRIGKGVTKIATFHHLETRLNELLASSSKGYNAKVSALQQNIFKVSIRFTERPHPVDIFMEDLQKEQPRKVALLDHCFYWPMSKNDISNTLYSVGWNRVHETFPESMTDGEIVYEIFDIVHTFMSLKNQTWNGVPMYQ